MILKNKIYKAALPSLLLLPLLMVSACHDDITYPENDSELIENNGHTVSTFSLESTHFNLSENVDSVRVVLIGKSGASECFGAGVERSEGKLRFRMVIPDTSSLPDGRYILTMRHPDGSSIPGRLSADFKSKMLSNVSIIIPKYMLDGSGTEEDPYIIGSNDDFSMFLINLADDDESYGAGLVFRQTVDVVAPNQSSLIPGRGYWGAPFAGIYKGDNHSITNLFYRGSQRDTSDMGIGLFTDLLGTASISDLSLSEVAMSGLYKECGIIAAHTSGEISLSNISVSGFITDGDVIGGFVGKAMNGNLTINNPVMKVSVSGKEDIGGIIGRVDKSASVNISGLSTPEYRFTVTGVHNVGGVIGRAIGKTEIYNVRLDHKVSEEDSDIKIITASEGCAGGIIGAISQDAENVSLTKCYVLCPVGGSELDCAGGMVGYSNQSSQLTIDDCRMQSVIEAKRYAGGVIGRADFPSGSKGMRIIGSDGATRVSADDSGAKVKGEDYVGGFAGWWKGKLDMKVQVKVNLPVTGKNYTGGLFGEISSSTIGLSKFIMGQSADNAGTTMRVSGSNHTGGAVGHLEKSTLTGNSKFDFEEGGHLRIPDSEFFQAVFSGVVTGDKTTGGLVGYAVNSKLQYLCSAARVTGNDVVGGVVGYVRADNKNYFLEDLTFKGEINCPDAEKVGGIAGAYYVSENGLIHDCINYAKVTGGEKTGGIVGHLYKDYPNYLYSHDSRFMDFKWCVNYGEINGKTCVGGIVGRFENGNNVETPNQYSNSEPDNLISYCLNSAPIKGEGGSKDHAGLGGIVGFSDKLFGVYNCANHGDVYGDGSFHGIGGIIGSAGNDPTGTGLVNDFRNVDIKLCMNGGTISSGNSESFVGGIAGYMEEGNKSDLRDCYNTGAIPCKQKHDSGGIVGCVDHLTNIYNCVNSGMVSHGNATIGTHKSGSLFDHGNLYFLEGTGKNWPSAKSVAKIDFNSSKSFGGLDFNSVWMESQTGPILRNCPWQNIVYAIL